MTGISRCGLAWGLPGQACRSAAASQIEFAPRARMADVERESHKDDCTSLAIKEASKSAAWAIATSGILVSIANGLSPTFQRALGVSGKAALVVSHASLTDRLHSLGALPHSPLSCPGLRHPGSHADPNWLPALQR